ncbi:Holliday junction resolvase RuvX, partial [Mycolicibacterium vaccae]|nr:Holliday junction resolvase RuvX [Mycolicibacterium vaccae]
MPDTDSTSRTPDRPGDPSTAPDPGRGRRLG